MGHFAQHGDRCVRAACRRGLPGDEAGCPRDGRTRTEQRGRATAIARSGLTPQPFGLWAARRHPPLPLATRCRPDAGRLPLRRSCGRRLSSLGLETRRGRVCPPPPHAVALRRSRRIAGTSRGPANLSVARARAALRRGADCRGERLPTRIGPVRALAGRSGRARHPGEPVLRHRTPGLSGRGGRNGCARGGCARHADG